MKVRFQADADLNEDIVTGIIRREPAVDFQTALAAGIRSFSDEQVLRRAGAEARILVSHDRKTMPAHFSKFIESQTSPGVIIVSQRADVLTVIQDLLLIWMASEAEEWINRLGAIPF